jgi:hypothetical protein
MSDDRLDVQSAAQCENVRSAIDEGRLKRGAAETMQILGKMFLASFLSGAAPPGFAHIV